MASGKVHMATNVVAGFVMVEVCFFSGLPVEPVLFGSVAGTFVTPDYDLRNNLPKSIICKVPIVGSVWSFIWWPYHKFIKHRSFWSHSPFISTIIRMWYLLLWLLSFILLMEYISSIVLLSNFNLDETHLLLVGAWCIQDLTHIILDKI